MQRAISRRARQIAHARQMVLIDDMHTIPLAARVQLFRQRAGVPHPIDLHARSRTAIGVKNLQHAALIVHDKGRARPAARRALLRHINEAAQVAPRHRITIDDIPLWINHK